MSVTLVKLKNLVKNAAKFEDMQFRLLLEDMVKEGGRDAESLLSEMVLSESIIEPVRINLIRSMGYILRTSFLISLRRILESEESIRIRKAALISISKFNDNRALNMLNAALKRIDNPILQDSISTEIGRIQKDNPILGLMPKFLNGVNDPKTFRTTLEVLKKILDPKDAQVFIYHLNSETPFVGDGAFEVLCWRGDESVKFSIFDFFRKKLEMIDCIAEMECYSLEDLLAKLERFIVRNPDTINYVLKEFKDIYKETSDIKVKDILINMFGCSRKREVLSFLEDVYNTEPGRRDQVIEKLSGNEDGAYILIYKYKNDPDHRSKLLRSLLTTYKGAEYITGEFDSLEPGWQQLVLENIDNSNYRFFESLSQRFLTSKDYGQKKFALDNIKENLDARFRQIMLDPAEVPVFLRMQNEYIETVTRVFPIQAFKLLVNRMLKTDTARALVRKYFSIDRNFIFAEPIITLTPADNLISFIKTIINFNNKELNVEIMRIFYNLKTFDYQTFQRFNAFVEEFKNERGQRISPEEKGAVNKLNSNFLIINGDLKKVEKGNTNINHFIEKDFPDYELLVYIIKNHNLSLFINRQRVLERIRKVFKLTNEIDAFDAVKFFLSQPAFSPYFLEEIRLASKSSNYLLKNDAQKLLETMPTPLRFVMEFEEDNTLYYACLEDQFHELMPEYQVLRLNSLDKGINGGDILITDTASLKRLASENRLNTSKLFVILNDNSEFDSIKELKPKVFAPPFTLYKVVKAILPEVFPLNQ